MAENRIYVYCRVSKNDGSMEISILLAILN